MVIEICLWCMKSKKKTSKLVCEDDQEKWPSCIMESPKAHIHSSKMCFNLHAYEDHSLTSKQCYLHYISLFICVVVGVVNQCSSSAHELRCAWESWNLETGVLLVYCIARTRSAPNSQAIWWRARGGAHNLKCAIVIEKKKKKLASSFSCWVPMHGRRS